MLNLIGRLVHVPRAVFAADIKRGLSKPPPNCIHWVAEVLQYDSSGTSMTFTLQLEVHDEQGKLATEEQDISLSSRSGSCGWITNARARTSASPASLMGTAL